MEIRQMQRDDLEEVLSLLTVAFQDTPFHQHIAPDKAERLLFLDASYRYRIIHALGVNDIDLVLEGDKITGFSSWTPPVLPKAASPSGPTMDDALAVCSAELRERFAAFLTLLTSARDQVIQQPFWSLGPIAVLPAAQGRGVASALLREKLKKIEATRFPCFLATQDKGNVSLYEHFGFQLVQEDSITKTVPHYTMIRSPK